MTELQEEYIDLEEDTQKDKFLTFLIGEEEYGIEIKYVMEIIGMQSIADIPELPQYVKGIVNLRGKIIPVIDVRIRFKKERRQYGDRTCIIIIEIEGLWVGLIVDTVVEVLSIPEKDIVPPPKVSNNYHHKYIMGIGKSEDRVKLLLNCNKLLNDEETEGLASLV